MADSTKKSRRKPIDFLGKKRLAGTISALAIVASMVLLVAPGPNYGIDFAGGTNIIASFDSSVTAEQLREAVEGDLPDVSVQGFENTSGESSHTSYLIRTREISTLDGTLVDSLREALTANYGEGTTVDYDATAADRVDIRLPRAAYGVDNDDVLADSSVYEDQKAERLSELEGYVDEAGFGDITLQAQGGERRFVVRSEGLQAEVERAFTGAFDDAFVNIDRIESVGPRVGEQLRNDSIKAVLIALIAILLYIAIRFDVRYAPGAVIALFHDVIITLGIFVIIQHEISLPIVAALLTIVGYSLNDTIVNFDRIRENVQLAGGKGDLEALVNRSLNECLSRTVLTSVTTALALVAIYILGGGLIRDFALAMLIGVIIGTYSSIFVASPVMVWTSGELDRREAERARANAAT